MHGSCVVCGIVSNCGSRSKSLVRGTPAGHYISAANAIPILCVHIICYVITFYMVQCTGSLFCLCGEFRAFNRMDFEFVLIRTTNGATETVFVYLTLFVLANWSVKFLISCYRTAGHYQLHPVIPRLPVAFRVDF